MKCTLVSPFGIDLASFPGGTHYIDKTIRLEPLTDEHKARIVDYLDALGREDLSKRVRTKPVYVVPLGDFGSASKDESLADLLLHMHRFSYELFVPGQVAMAAFEYDGENITGHTFDRTDLLQGNGAEISLGKGIWDQQKTYLKFLYQHIRSAPLAGLAIKRLCRALKAGATTDGIIDLAISLECLVNAQSEIKFQFSLNHALTTEDDPKRRHEAFAVLQTLYDVRSKAVHGGAMARADKTKMQIVIDRWIDLISICQNSITYYLLFCSQKEHNEWPSHLRMLALGEGRFGFEEQNDQD